MNHAAVCKATSADKKTIEIDGLIHFTSKENLEKILNEGLKGSVSNMSFLEKKIGEQVWTYQYKNDDYIEIKHKSLLNTKKGKNDSKNYNVCIKLTGFCKEDLDKLYIRKSIFCDRAIVYRGKELKVDKIEVLKYWD